MTKSKHGGRWPFDEIERFMSFVKIDTETGCWMWLGAVALTGLPYGRFSYTQGAHVYAHRWSYEYHKGPIPPRYHVMHACDVSLCVNPMHLSVGTALENCRDKIAKGRARYVQGSDNPGSRLTENDVREMRRLYQDGFGIGCNNLAKIFGISKGQAHRIVSRQQWKCVKD